MADAEIPTIVLTYKYRLLPTKRQHRALEAILEDQRQLYNAALEERIDCYRKTGQSLTYRDQCKSITVLRHEECYSHVPVNVQRWTILRLAHAYDAFFRRLKKKSGRPGFPRFRGAGWWNSFGFAEAVGIKFDGCRLRFRGMPSGIRLHLHRPMPLGRPLSCSFTRDSKGWTVAIVVAVERQPLRDPVRCVGIDLGVSSLATCSDGHSVPNPRAARKADKAMRLAQRALSRCRRGSNRRKKIRKRVTNLHAKIRNTRSTSLHQASALLVKRYDLLAVEQLNIRGLAGSRLARDINDASWSILRNFLRYKAERAGAHYVEVDPKFTSQTCPDCGTIAKKELAQRTHSCDCGCVLDRDVAAARVILSRAVSGPGVLNVAGCGERALGSISAS
jgi:putative transposase